MQALIHHGYLRSLKDVCLCIRWEVYFTTDIPINKGPWKLWGLPGLIVRAEDKDRYFRYELNNFEKQSSSTPIIYVHHKFDIGKGAYAGEAYKHITKKTYQQYEKTFNEDFAAFILISRTTMRDG